MRKYLLAAVAAAAISSPALARDGSPYIGIEGGLVIDGDLDLDLDVTYYDETTEYDEAFDVDFKRGLDLDLIAGYDFGMFRLEGELGYKRLRGDKFEIDDELEDEFDLADEGFDVDDNGSIVSLMANGLFDFGDDSGWNGYVGGGIGRARVKFAGERDSTFAWQFIAGARKAISPTIDVGLKYRYFRTGKIEAFNDEFDFGGDGVVGFEADGKFRSHSILASLIFNFAPPPPPPPPPVIVPPPPPPPATQTCPDGSVILATDMCPPAPEPYVPPPPPPEPAPERG